MSLADRLICENSGCGHRRHLHSGSHVKGSRQACLHRDPSTGKTDCPCILFEEVVFGVVRPDSQKDSR